MNAAPSAALFGRRVGRIHCLGVGGMGVCPLAIYLAGAGWAVSGEDDALTPEVSALLKEAGVLIGPIPKGCDLLVRSSAVAETHPSCSAAVRAGVPAVRRGELLAEATRDKKLVAICGSHGKTTTTAMLVTALRKAGFPAGYVGGGLFNESIPPARFGSNEWVVAEIDESDGTIAAFNPEITVLVNFDWDHPDRYRDPSDLEAAFSQLCERTRGTVLISDACVRSRAIAPSAESFGKTGDYSGVSLEESAGKMTLRLGGKFNAIDVQVGATGDFNASNATAAFAAALLMGIEPREDLLASYPGVRRRQAVLMEDGGLTVMEDYAHHPSEIRSLLPNLRSRIRTGGRLVVVFQPHRFSRTARFKADFAAALAPADVVLLLDVYPAGEAPLPGGTSTDLLEEFRKSYPAAAVRLFRGDGNACIPALVRESRPGDLLAFVGAGDIDRTARDTVQALKAAIRRAALWDGLAEKARPMLSKGARLAREEPLAAKTTIRVGGEARLYAEPSTEEDLRSLLLWARGEHIPVFVLGRGSNLIVPDEGVNGLVLSLSQAAWAGFEVLSDGRVRVGAGLRLKNLCGLVAAAGLSGFEFLEGIPGSVGGALRMNAGAMGGWIFDLVDEVRVISRSGLIEDLPRASLNVDYRYCAELGEGIALGAVLHPVSNAQTSEIAKKVDDYRKKRHETQPREPSAGCIFKNPPGNSAGRLIEESGLKGTRVGGAEVSLVHGNFVINRGEATSADILELIRRIRSRVREVKGIELEPEVLLYGEDWKNFL